jgi:hypothetical protein
MLGQGIAKREQLVFELAARERARNAASVRVNWMFTTKKPAPKWAAPIPS